jgi:HlyD family secretion protein
VTTGTDNPQSAAIASIFDPQQIQAWVDLNQRDSGTVFTGQDVELTTDADPQRPITGVVKQIMPQANLQKNTVQVKITIPDPPADFRPELSVKVVFLPPEESPAGTETAEPGVDEEPSDA